MKLKTYIDDAVAKKVAIGHFNISNLEALRAIFNAAKNLNVPVIIGVSEGERDFVGVKQAVALVKSLREEHNFPIFINADHTYSFERVKEAVDAGFDAVIYDGAKLPIEENIQIAKKCVEYAKSVNPDILIEAELGYIGTSSQIWKETPAGAALNEDSLTTAEQAIQYVQGTGVDLFAPAVGNIHGLSSTGVNPPLFTNRVKEIYEAVKVPLVLHGASGNSREDIQQAIKNGVAIVHINTEIRVAFKEGLKKSLAEHPDEVAPYKLLAPALKAVEAVVTEKLKFFNMM